MEQQRERANVGRAGSVLLAVMAASCGGETEAAADELIEGRWQAALESPGGPLTFGLEFERSRAGLRAVVWNGEERRPAGPVNIIDDAISFTLPPYRSYVIASLEREGRALVGRWERDRGSGFQPVLPFAAVEGDAPRDRATELSADQIASIGGRWAVQFAGDEDPSVGVFEVHEDGEARGTFLTTLGDYRFLAGRFDGQTLLLACFDGAHAFLFRAELQDDGSLAGDFWSRDSYHDTWTATKDANAELPDDFALTTWTGAKELYELTFPDTAGEMRSLDDEKFAGDARLLVVFGSWCPNCNDLTEYLVELDARFEGLSILGLAFEFGADDEARAKAVRDYLAHHRATYPALVCGPPDKSLASAALPVLDRVRAYPTTVFMDRQGNVSAVHTGFSGPATGDRHALLRTRFESEIESLLAAD